MTLTLAELQTQAKNLAIRLESRDLGSSVPAITVTDEINQVTNFILANRPGISQANARSLATAVVSYVRARPQSILATAITQPGASFGQGLSDLFGGLGGWQQLVFRIAVGAVGIILIIFGILLIGGEATLNNVASKFGKSIGQGIKGGGKK